MPAQLPHNPNSPSTHAKIFQNFYSLMISPLHSLRMVYSRPFPALIFSLSVRVLYTVQNTSNVYSISPNLRVVIYCTKHNIMCIVLALNGVCKLYNTPIHELYRLVLICVCILYKTPISRNLRVTVQNTYSSSSNLRACNIQYITSIHNVVVLNQICVCMCILYKPP